MRSGSRRTSDTTPRTSLIEGVTAPLGFFVLALLIVESFLGAVVIGANVHPNDTMTALWAGVVMFLLVVTLVFLLVWFKPEALTFGREEHIKVRQMLAAKSPEEEAGPKKPRGAPRSKKQKDTSPQQKGAKP